MGYEYYLSILTVMTIGQWLLWLVVLFEKFEFEGVTIYFTSKKSAILSLIPTVPIWWFFWKCICALIEQFKELD